jgi:glutathione-regulated potassium-efflux system ancillary protein KefF
MRFLPPLVLHAAHRLPEEEVARHVDVFAGRLRSHPDWPELDSLQACPACDVPTADRPQQPACGPAGG